MDPPAPRAASRLSLAQRRRQLIEVARRIHLFKTPLPPLETSDLIESGVAFTLAGLRGGIGDVPKDVQNLRAVAPDEVRA